MITTSQPGEQHRQTIHAANRNGLADISAIHIRQDLAHNEKVLAFLEEISNPYRFLCGDVSVSVCYADKGPKLAELLQDYFIRIKQG